MTYALWFCNTLATAKDAVYNCIDNPKSLGKNIKNIIKTKGNGTCQDDVKYKQFLSETGIGTLMNDIRNKVRENIIDVRVIEVFKIPVWSVTRFFDGGKKWVCFGIPVLRTEIATNKIRYYFCGLYLWRTYTK